MESNYKEFRGSEMVSLYEYYGRAQGIHRGLEIYGQAVEDRIHISNRAVNQGGYSGLVRTYPRTWLDKIVFIDLAHQTGALSDQELVIQERAKHEK